MHFKNIPQDSYKIESALNVCTEAHMNQMVPKKLKNN